ncbi:MAG: SGNH/GDSL hydrolase family protein [Rhodobacteraceae bacterium]|nr:SGNH/GDSL hydrolase family protein [Paracoccaceae bacterium]
MGRLGDIALGPFVAAQAAYVSLRVERLPEAAGLRAGEIGNGPPLRLLIVGDSGAAGVGARDQSEALSGQLSSRLATDYLVRWRLIARSGETTSQAVRRLQRTPPAAFDIALVALGINDAKNGIPQARWMKATRQVITLLHKRFSVREVYYSGFPPVRELARLPEPLRGALSARTLRFDAALQALLDQTPGTHYLPMEFSLGPEAMASDGVHPGPLMYAQWAALAESAIRRDLQSDG